MTPLPKRVDGFISGMSSNGLWICMNEMQDLSATNTLYVAAFREKLSRQEKHAWAISMLTSVVARQVARSTRVYADGLTKLEPGQIARLRIPKPGRVKKAVSTYKEICSLFLSGRKRDARELADASVNA